MLILSRKVNQSIIINENIIVTVKEISSDGVKIAIDASKDVKILRKELVDSVVADNMDASHIVSRNQLKSLIKTSKVGKENE